MVIVDEDKIVKTPLVSVRVHSYNQEKYIEQCLNSILSQKTNFEFEIILANNPSEDHTRDICIRYQKEHPDKIRLLLRDKNMGFFANFFETGNMCRGKYIARCDADDYWYDDNKLQKQVDLLESDDSIGLCYTNSMVLNDNTGSLTPAQFRPYKCFENHLVEEPIMTLTVMHRKILYDEYVKEIQPQDKGWLMEDSPISLWYSANSKIVGMDCITTVYRVIDNSISHPVDYEKKLAYNQSLLDIRLLFWGKYISNKDKVRKAIQNDFYRRDLSDSYSAKNLSNYIDSLTKYKPVSFRNFVGVYGRLLILLIKKHFVCD